MKLTVHRKDTILYPDNRKVIGRFFYLGEERARKLISRILAMDEEEVRLLLGQILREFSTRHRSITTILMRHYQKVAHLVQELNHTESVSEYRKLLIGCYFTMEYAIESAALFNPSVVEDPDQTNLEEGQKRVIISLRATGEGHISSLVFRRAIIDRNNEIIMQEPGFLVDEAEVVRDHLYLKKRFVSKLMEMEVPADIYSLVLDKLPEEFTYDQIRECTLSLINGNNQLPINKRVAVEEILWLADSYTRIRFSLDTDLSERVIFPISRYEKNGIEDARFVKFTNDNGESVYYATYTAYDGYTILPKLIETEDFCTFRIFPLHGKYAIDKNLALFPCKIGGKYAMVSRIDGQNNYIMFSKNLYRWSHAELLQEPAYPWEFVQVGNAGSPIETPQGWLLITHGVGPMRKYCLGASLLDPEDPRKVIGRLKEPLLLPADNERTGYVPNVVYSCGAIVHNEELIIPYAMSDYASAFASVNLNDLLGEILRNKI